MCVYVSRTYVFINQTSCDVKDITKTDVPVIYISSRECLKKKKMKPGPLTYVYAKEYHKNNNYAIFNTLAGQLICH